ncbi:MAG: hypothetical protein ABI901_05180 [Roseiflexaceae bacterium]
MQQNDQTPKKEAGVKRQNAAEAPIFESDSWLLTPAAQVCAMKHVDYSMLTLLFLALVHDRGLQNNRACLKAKTAR